MIFITNSSGTVISAVPEQVYQGSVKANSIYFVAPFTQASTVTVNFLLPDGTYGENTILMQRSNIDGEVKDTYGKQYSVWSCDLLGSMTKLYGKVTLQFKVFAGSQIISTSSSTFDVIKGVPPIDEEPEESVIEQILEELSAINQRLDNIIGVAIYPTTASVSKTTTQIDLEDITIPYGRTLNVGDFIIGNYCIFRVTSIVPDEYATVEFFLYLKGSDAQFFFVNFTGETAPQPDGLTQRTMSTVGLEIDTGDIVFGKFANPNSLLQTLVLYTVSEITGTTATLNPVKFIDGEKGVRGSIWRTGSGVPTIQTSDEVGDYYINTSDGNVYKVIKNTSNVKIWQSQGFSVKGVNGLGIDNLDALNANSSGSPTVLYDTEDGATILDTLQAQFTGGTHSPVTVSLTYKIPIIGSDEIIADASEDDKAIELHLDNTVSNKINNSLQTPVQTPTSEELVGIGTNKAQTRITIGDGLSLDNHVLSATGDGTVKSVSIDTGTPAEPDEDGNVNLEIGLQDIKDTLEENTLAIDQGMEVISGITEKIPSAATYTNQLADKAFVNSSIQNMASFYVTTRKGAGTDDDPYRYEPFATKAELTSTLFVYINGVEKTPSKNDYCIVLADESKQGSLAQAPTTRYYYPIEYISEDDTPYDKDAWQFQYIVNNTGLTAVQVSALNSGITSTGVEQIDTNKSDITSLKSRMTTAESDISALETTVNGIPNTYAQKTGTYSGMTVGTATKVGHTLTIVEEDGQRAFNGQADQTLRFDKYIKKTELTNVDGISYSSSDGLDIYYNEPNDARINIPIKAGNGVTMDETQTGEFLEVKADTTVLATKSELPVYNPTGDATESLTKIKGADGTIYGVSGGTSDLDFEYDIPDQFDTPLLSLSGDELSTDIVEDVERYNVYVDSEYIGYIDTDNVFHDERPVTTETWVINESISGILAQQTISFISNNENYNTFALERLFGSTFGLKYDDNTVADGSISEDDELILTFFDQNYRTVTFDRPLDLSTPIGQWFSANANKQGG